MNLMTLRQQGIDIQQNIPLSRFTFTKTGGPAKFLAFPKNLPELELLVKSVRQENMQLTVIGNASNLIIKDGGIDGLVIILTKMNQIIANESNCTISAQAGATIINTSNAARDAGLTGLEFAAGIPGSVGGAVFMNAGAYDGETENVIKSVKVLTRDGVFKTYTHDEMQFGYRHSIVQDTGDIVVSATFGLKAGEKKAIADRMKYLNDLRRAKQPLEYPSCGSVFKRPKGHFVGPMIIEAGLQGTRIGGAEDSKKHAGFIINVGGATATDYLNLIHLIQKVIKEKFDVDLQTEVRIIGKEKRIDD